MGEFELIEGWRRLMAPNRRQLVGTFADLITSGHELTVNCEACQHRAPVNVRGVVGRYDN
jgi:hypothetical protein